MLKEYKNPPVTEVVMALHFDPIASLTNIELSKKAIMLAEKLGGYTIEETPYLEVPMESDSPRKSGAQFRIDQGLPKMSLKLMSQCKTSVICFQDNRFSVAWAGQTPGGYPRYENLKHDFFSALKNLRDVLTRDQLDRFEVTQCGIQYINNIDDDDGSGHLLLQILNMSNFHNHEGITFSTTQRLEGEKEIGRLYLRIHTVLSIEHSETDGKLVERRRLRMPLTFRGVPKEISLQGIARFFDRGHEAIVKTFSDSLSDEGRKKFKETGRE